MSYREEIGDELQTIRVQKGLTVRELGEMCGMQHSSIVKIENGKYNVSVDILGKVAEALGYRLTFDRIGESAEQRTIKKCKTFLESNLFETDSYLGDRVVTAGSSSVKRFIRKFEKAMTEK